MRKSILIIVLVIGIVSNGCNSQKKRLEERYNYTISLSDLMQQYSNIYPYAFDTNNIQSDLTYYINSNENLIKEVNNLKIPEGDTNLLILTNKFKKVLEVSKESMQRWQREYSGYEYDIKNFCAIYYYGCQIQMQELLKMMTTELRKTRYEYERLKK